MNPEGCELYRVVGVLMDTVRQECATEMGLPLEAIPTVMSTWDTNLITPGTSTRCSTHSLPIVVHYILLDCSFSGFMNQLSQHIRGFVQEQITSDEQWRHLEVCQLVAANVSFH